MSKKIVIVIDNLDRCDAEIAKETLNTIKNFLNKPKCIFIIPTDHKAIKRHLKYDDVSIENEFLRKYFNTIIQIKNILTPNLLKILLINKPKVVTVSIKTI